MLELLVKEQIETYLENHDIITEYQLSFRKHHLCRTVIQAVIGNWKYLVSKREK